MVVLREIRQFEEYPLDLQKLICRYAVFFKIGPNRTIVRQGQQPEYFYWILSGKAVVTSIDAAGKSHTEDFLTVGKTVDESALLMNQPRPHTVMSQVSMQLLAMEKKDYIKYCHMLEENGEPIHIAYFRRLPALQAYNISALLQSSDQIVIHYFRKGKVIVKNSRFNDWLYIIKAGSCQVLQETKKVTANLKQSQEHTHGSPVEQEDGTSTDVRLKLWSLSCFRGEETMIPPFDISKSRMSDTKSKSAFVQVDILKPQDMFGFAELLFEHCPVVSLVSNGAECVMIKKSLFIKHMDYITSQLLLREAST
jgi:CRP-like cAMP-binding protein